MPGIAATGPRPEPSPCGHCQWRRLAHSPALPLDGIPEHADKLLQAYIKQIAGVQALLRVLVDLVHSAFMLTVVAVSRHPVYPCQCCE